MAEKNPIVTLEVADYEPIKIELYPEIAPNTVNNFISLVNQGFYNGLTFHRIAVKMWSIFMHDEELGTGRIRHHGTCHGDNTCGML